MFSSFFAGWWILFGKYKGIFSKTPPPPRLEIPCKLPTFPLKFLDFENPHPRNFESFLWGGGGYDNFLGLQIMLFCF